MERYSVRYVHKVSPSSGDVGPDVEVSPGSWSDSRALGRELRRLGVLGRGASVRSFRAEGDRVVVFPAMPGLTTYWHSVVLTRVPG